MELLEQFALGELEAFEALFRQFQGEVYRWILRIVWDSGVVEDLTVASATSLGRVFLFRGCTRMGQKSRW